MNTEQESKNTAIITKNMIINERIKELRKEQNLTQVQLAKRSGFTQGAITDWEKGKKLPSADAIIAICKAFDVSADYLLGLEDEHGTKPQDYSNEHINIKSHKKQKPNLEQQKKIARAIARLHYHIDFKESIKELRKETGDNQRKMAKKIDVSNGLISLWENGKTEPTLHQILKICNTYDITPNELLGFEEYTTKIK